MNSGILLTHSYFLRFDPKQWKLQQPYPPLATLYVGAVLKNAGYKLDFFDVMFRRNAHEISAAIKNKKPKYFIICDDGFNYLTKMCLTNMREAAFEMLALSKAAGCVTIISSSDSTDHSEKYLKAGADYIVAGEAEQTIHELINALECNQSISSIAGLRFLNNSELTGTAPRVNLRDLDQLPFPAWELIDMDQYRSRWVNRHGYFSLNMTTTRGCPYKCNWCAKPIYGNRYNSRSAENVVEELKMLKAKYGFDHIWFADDIFGLKPGWVHRFAELTEQHKLELKFKIQSRVDLLLEDEKHPNQISSLAKAGCNEVWVGAESGSQKILDAMDKGTKVEQIYTATRLLKLHKIRACFFLQFGYPGETKNDIDATLSMLLELMPDDVGISVSYPLPGTKFYENVKSQLKEKENWTDSDELAMMFSSTFPPEFYKKLQRYVHLKYRAQKAKLAWSQHKDLRKGLSLAYRIPQTIVSKAGISKYVA